MRVRILSAFLQLARGRHAKADDDRKVSASSTLTQDSEPPAETVVSPKIVVVGGVVMDFLFRSPAWPQPDEAVQGVLTRAPGGKGLNQAVACARLMSEKGVRTALVSAVAEDEFGERLCKVLTEYGSIDAHITKVKASANIHTDVTGVLVADGRPGYIGCRSASNELSAELVEQHASLIASAEVVCITCDVPLEAARAAIQIASNAHRSIIVNAAPPPETATDMAFFDGVDYLVLNDWEARSWLQLDIVGQVTREMLSEQLSAFGPLTVIITTGSRGCLVRSGNSAADVERVRAFHVEEKDMAGANDAFCAALAVALIERMQHPERIRFASAAAAVACTAEGAFDSMPYRSTVDKFLREREGETLSRARRQSTSVDA